MSACEPCWEEAFRRALSRGGRQTDHYHDLLRENDGKEGHGPVCDEEFGLRIHPCEHASVSGLTCEMCGKVVGP